MRYCKCIFLVLILVIIVQMPVLALQVGDTLTDFELKDLTGKNVRISDYRGEYVLFDVWATWCKPCVAAMGEYQKNLAQFKEAGVKLVAISVDARVEEPKEYVEKNKLTFTVLHDKKNFPTKIWGVKGIPTIFLVNPDGKVIFTEVGWASFATLWKNVKRAIEVSKKPPVQVTTLKEGTYTAKLVDLAEVFREMELPLQVDLRPFAASSSVKLKKEPNYEQVPKYANLNIAGKTYTIVAEKTGKADVATHLYIDFDGDLNLTDEGERIRLEVGTDDLGGVVSNWVGELSVPLTKDLTLVYRMAVYFTEDVSGYYVLPKRGYYTKLITEKNQVEAWAIDLNCNGYFGDGTDIFAVDLNQNGKFDTLNGEEWIFLKNLLQLSKNKYQVKITPTGKEITIKLAK